MSKALDRVVGEARRGLQPKSIDWDAVEGGLFARIEAERREARTRHVRERSHVWTSLAAALAAATIVVTMAATRGHDQASHDGDAVALVTSSDGNAMRLHVNGKPAAPGAPIHEGDVLESLGGQARLDRPGKVAVVLEAGARAVVTRAESPLVLSLELGAVDAEVVPVATGEAFAVDVRGSRVAVHGTHLRVARDGEKVTVDLSEGVVSVGEAPRLGSEFGSLVTAPAHAEFTDSDARATLAVVHDRAAVRAPESAFEQAAAAGSPAAPAANNPVGARVDQAAPRTGELRGEVRPAPSVAPKAAPAAADSTPVAAPEATPPATSVAEPAPIPSADAEQTIANAVRACMAEHPNPENVTVVVSTTLHLVLAGDGNVRGAQFYPPVAPDVNACAAQAIYKTRFTHDGSASIHIDFRH